MASQLGADGGDGRLNALLVLLGIGAVGIGMRGVVRGQRIADVVHVNQRGGGRHPRMRIGLALVGASANADRLHALRHHRLRHVFHAAEELFKPRLQIQPVPQHQLRALRARQIARRGLVFVNFRAGPGDGLHLRRIARHIAGHVGNHGERGHHLEFGRWLRRRWRQPKSKGRRESRRENPCASGSQRGAAAKA